MADYLHLIKEGTVPVVEESLSKCTYAYLHVCGNGRGKEWHHVGFLIGRMGGLQESVGGSWMAVLDEQCHKRYHPLVA